MYWRILCLLACILLLAGIPTGWPYAYYELLRIFIFLSSILLSINFYQRKQNNLVIIFIVEAFLFNPVSPIHLTKQSWIIIDILSSVFFLISAVIKYNNKE